MSHWWSQSMHALSYFLWWTFAFCFIYCIISTFNTFTWSWILGYMQAYVCSVMQLQDIVNVHSQHMNDDSFKCGVWIFCLWRYSIVDYMTMKWAICVIGAKVIRSFNIDPMFATMETWRETLSNNKYIPQHGKPPGCKQCILVPLHGNRPWATNM